MRPEGRHLTCLEVEALFRAHDQKACLASNARAVRCRICTALNAQFVDALRSMLGKVPLSGSGKTKDSRLAEQRFADFGGADVASYNSWERRTESGRPTQP